MNAINTYPDEILAVDDSSANLKLLEDILSNAGYRVRLANDGELALRSTRIQPPALILLDIRLPGMDGYEVCRRLKDDEKTRSIPIIFLSILDNEEEKVKAFQAGGVDFINKPIRTAEVLARINTHLALRHAQLDLELRNAELEAARETLEEKVRERSVELEQKNHRLREQIEEHLHTLKALRESEAKFRRLIDTANEGIWVFGSDYLTTFVNARMAEMLGFNSDEMAGRAFTDFMFDEDTPYHQARMKKRRQGISEDYEHRLRRKDGQTVWTLVSATPIFDDENHFQGTFGMFTDITERKQAEEALCESHKRFQLVMDSLDALVYVTDMTTYKILFLNRYGQETWGDAVGQTCWQTLQSDQTGPCPFCTNARLVLPTGESAEPIVWKFQNTANLHWYECRDQTIRWTDGRLVRMEIATDITERKKMEEEAAQVEEALRESEELHRLTLSNISDAVFITDDAGSFKYICPNVDLIFGYSFQEVQAMGSILDLLGGNLISMSEIEALGELKNIEHDVTEKSGRIHSLLVNIKRISIKGGTLLYVCRDITERKRAEAALRESENRLNAIVWGSPIPQFVIDRNHRVTHWNKALEKYTGIKSEDMIGTNRQWIAFYTYERPCMADLLVDGAIETIPVWYKGKYVTSSFLEGAYETTDFFSHIGQAGTWLYFTAAPIRDTDGGIIGAVETLADISERKRAEEALLKLNEELEQRVNDRTTQLEAANKELEAFAYSISHDLRAPLRHIDGYLEMLKEQIMATLDTQSQHYIDAISKATRHMDMLINDLLSFSRMGRSEMSAMEVDLNCLVQEVIHELELEATSRTIDWRVSTLPVVSGDCAMLRMVLVNLISNSLKFTRPKKIAKIEIGCEKEDESEVVIFVRDNGVGFDINYVDKLFGVFQRLHRDDEFEGTGIGLANVRRIISRHGGRVWAEGKVNHGATFYFTLPQSKGEKASE